MVLVAVYSERSWDLSAPCVEPEDFSHLLFASVTGMAFAAGVVVVGFADQRRAPGAGEQSISRRGVAS